MKRSLVFLVILSWVGLVLFSPFFAPYAQRGWRKAKRVLGFASDVSPILPSRTPPPPARPLPTRFVPRKQIETAKWFNGLTLHSQLETQLGTNASQERERDKSYELDLRLNVKVPTASQDLKAMNPALASQWPALATLVSNANVSSFFHGLYERKTDWLNGRLIRLDQLLSRHNFYDCDTILEIQNPETQRKLLFIQAEMDVVSDGSDPDRLISLPTNTANYQPFTSYRWLKQSTNISPFIAPKQEKLKRYQTELSATNTLPQRRQELLGAIDQLRREIYDLNRYSYLVASLDPFIVLPGFIFRYPEQAYRPKIGDYAVVVFENRFYPAIVGDIGPSYQIGEASLQLATRINPQATSYQRPVSDLKVSYLVFPDSAEATFSTPDLQKWHEKCAILLNEMGDFVGHLE
ncbi:MAG: glycoside hydrolase family 75 protein [Verrucomicrobiia bacterium]